MPLDKTRYCRLERSFKEQVEKDKVHAIERVKQVGRVYLPCQEPEGQVDYIFVGMEPSFNWARNIDAEAKIAEGFRNFRRPNDDKHPLALFICSIERFLCEPAYHLTDLSKGAMPVEVAALDRDRRYKEWYPLLLEEIEIVGKPGAPVIAIGTKVWDVFQRRDLSAESGRPLHRVLHYSDNAAPHRGREAASDPEGFAEFKAEELGRWPADLSLSKEQLIFTYRKQFDAIRAHFPK